MAEKSQSLANALYTAAQSRLREKYQDEFDTILDGLYEERGLTRKRRLSAEERAEVKREEAKAKAKAKIDALLLEFPDIEVPVL